MSRPAGNERKAAVRSASPLDGAQKPLGECVHLALDAYFQDLDGHAAGDVYRMVMGEVEPAMLRTVMDYAGGNQTRASEILGITRSTLRKKLKQYGID